MNSPIRKIGCTHVSGHGRPVPLAATLASVNPPAIFTKLLPAAIACAVYGTLLLSLCANSYAGSLTRHPPRVITRAIEAHDLPASEAVRAYPVHLRGVVTFYDPVLDPRQIILFVHDASGSIFIGLATTPVGIATGSVIDVRAVTGMGDFAPVLKGARATVVGTAPLPRFAPTVSLTRLLTGQEDGQWVEVEGIVHSIFETPGDIVLQVAMRDGLISATMPRESGGDYAHLVDARVKVHAHAAPLFNGDGQMIGARLLTPNLSAIQVVEPSLADPFALPLRTIDSLSRFSSMAVLPRRIHVRGRVTLSYPGALLCVRDATRGLCAHTTQTTPLAVGQIADVVGFAESGAAAPSLGDANYRALAPGSPILELTSPPRIAPVQVTPAQALYGSHDSELVRMEGDLIGRDLAAPDTTLMLASDGFVYAVVLPQSLAGPASEAGSGTASDTWKKGSRLSITGICSVKIDAERTGREGGAAKRQSFRILLRSPADVILLQKPSWWTPAHTLLILAIALFVALLVLGWIIVLTRRLRRQTHVIRQSEETFRHMAQHDALTGLPTRLLLRDRLDSALEKSKRSGLGLGLLMLDLDNFKHINDSLGHHAGDQALKTSAFRLSQSVRGSDTVARISGDEFVILVPDLADPVEAELVAAKVVAALSAPFRVGDREVPLSASVGVCTAFGGGVDAESLLMSVDTAMYHAKSQGRNRFQLYTPAMAQETARCQKLREGLERALVENELEVFYQPLVRFQDGELDGFEALLRWRSRELGLIMPADFIPIAEETGKIVAMSEWLLTEACREVGVLERQLGCSFLLSVNLSRRQMQHPESIGKVAQALEAASRSPRRLEIEITESVLMSGSAAVQASLSLLRGLGVRLAIDDFGVGFSSLAYITRFAIDRIKIDRSFVRKCMREESSLAVIRAMVAMAHGLSTTVVAEGVETAAEFAFLREEQCDIAQGYFLSRPVRASELLALVSELAELAPSRPGRLHASAAAIRQQLQCPSKETLYDPISVQIDDSARGPETPNKRA